LHWSQALRQDFHQFGGAVETLLAHAGHGFLDQDCYEVQHVFDTTIAGTICLIHKVGRDVRARGQGRILIAGSTTNFMPGTYQAVYNGTKAFINSLLLVQEFCVHSNLI
jgi:uncharacterized protein